MKNLVFAIFGIAAFSLPAIAETISCSPLPNDYNESLEIEFTSPSSAKATYYEFSNSSYLGEAVRSAWDVPVNYSWAHDTGIGGLVAFDYIGDDNITYWITNSGFRRPFYCN